MPNFTKDQQLAIDKDNTNIIVSAGAGSGKTAVLTARVIRKLKQNIDINKLLVLTFTNEASKEMKDRIRKAIKEDASLKGQLAILDSSYITTFDSFALSIVKKYHYVLNIPKNISIVESSIIDLKRKEFLEAIFDELYKEEDENFLKLISDFCVKSDDELKENILKINNVLEQKIDKEEYLESYIDNYYSKDCIGNLIEEYLEKILSIKEEIVKLYNKVINSESDKVATGYSEALGSLIDKDSYDDIKRNLEIKLPQKVEDKESKEQIKEGIKKLKELTIYDSIDDIKTLYESTSIYTKSIVNILKKLTVFIDNYKKENNCYEFIDISKMAIKIVEENEKIKDEIKYFYNEIMIDEYQDTNDLQELFISLIENNNVYMVGDIKQSIYRFRNANPMIFKNKYDMYEQEDNGFKIDLTKNFRSREEVLDNINTIFDKIMDNFLGGAEYQKSHRMVFGNETYTKENNEKISNHLDFYNYDYNDKTYTKDEIEAFIIAEDIIKKVNEGYQVLDKNTQKLRNVNYSDFCIIMDRNAAFDLYKKVFEYKGIPLAIYKDEILTASYDVLTLKNIIKYIIKINKKQFDTEFKYLYTSIARSYLFEYSDEKIFESFIDNEFINNDIYQIAKTISDKLEDYTINNFIEDIISKFKFYEKVIKTKDIKGFIVRILYIQKMCKSLEKLGYTPFDLDNYLSDMISSNTEIKYKLNPSSDNSVKIMNIHRSKGLEFPICYFSGLYKTFNVSDLNDRFMYDKKYGIITPYYKDAIGTLPSKILAKDEYIKEEISEKIRLFYVAVTRAKEKMIFIAPLDDAIYNEEELVSANTRLKYKSILNMINDVKDSFEGRITNINYNDIVTKDYHNYKDIDLSKIEKEDKIEIRNVNIDYEIISDNKFSKTTNKLVKASQKEAIDKGLKIHSIFEIEDLLNPIDEHVKKFVSHEEFKDLKNAKVYKEYEFVYTDDNQNYHGIIDLMVVYDDYIDIIDYKLSNIDDENYIKQLEGYKAYIEKKSGKKVNLYLYSIEKDELRAIALSFLFYLISI